MKTVKKKKMIKINHFTDEQLNLAIEKHSKHTGSIYYKHLQEELARRV
jgi:hypothetical protein